MEPQQTAITVTSLKTEVERSAAAFFERTNPAAATARAAVFAAAIADIVTSSPDGGKGVLACTPTSIRAGLAYLYALDLPPSRGMVYLYPRSGVLQVSLTHRALLDLARRGGWRVSCQTVHDGDALDIAYTSEGVEYRHHRGTSPRTWDTCTGAYVAVWAPGAATGSLPCDLLELDRSYLDKAVGAGGPVWKKWPLEMAQKSALKAAFARGYVTIHAPADAPVMPLDSDDDAPPVPTTPDTASQRRTLEDAITAPTEPA